MSFSLQHHLRIQQRGILMIYNDIKWYKIIFCSIKNENIVDETVGNLEENERKRNRDACRILRLIKSMHTINNPNVFEERLPSKNPDPDPAINIFQLENENCDQERLEKNAFQSTKLSLENNESGFSSMCSFFIPAFNQIGLPGNDVQSPEVDVLWV